MFVVYVFYMLLIQLFSEILLDSLFVFLYIICTVPLLVIRGQYIPVFILYKTCISIMPTIFYVGIHI